MTSSYFLNDNFEIAMFLLILLENRNSFWQNNKQKVCADGRSSWFYGKCKRWCIFLGIPLKIIDVVYLRSFRKFGFSNSQLMLTTQILYQSFVHHTPNKIHTPKRWNAKRWTNYNQEHAFIGILRKNRRKWIQWRLINILFEPLRRDMSISHWLLEAPDVRLYCRTGYWRLRILE